VRWPENCSSIVRFWVRSDGATFLKLTSSPKGVLGSSALAADDDEVVSAHGARRVGGSTPIGIGTIGAGPGGPNWGGASPRSAVGEASLRGGLSYRSNPSTPILVFPLLQIPFISDCLRIEDARY
jgi:hypothetical protein